MTNSLSGNKQLEQYIELLKHMIDNKRYIRPRFARVIKHKNTEMTLCIRAHHSIYDAGLKSIFLTQTQLFDQNFLEQ